MPHGIDEQEFAQLLAAQERIGNVWRAGTMQVLTERNPKLLRELEMAEEVIDSLLIIPNKPKSSKRALKDAFDKYERVAMDCVTYANRHLKQHEQGETKSEG